MNNEEYLYILDNLSEDLPGSILIGGWSTFAKLNSGTTHDIDIIIPPYLKSSAKNVLDNYSENSHFGSPKGSGYYLDVPLDVYFSYESKLEGEEVSLSVEKLIKYIEVTWRGFNLLSLEGIIVSKIPAVIGRVNSDKGKKDATALFKLISLGADPKITREILLECVDRSSVDIWDTAEKSIIENLNTNKERDIVHKFFYNAIHD